MKIFIFIASLLLNKSFGHFFLHFLSFFKILIPLCAYLLNYHLNTKSGIEIDIFSQISKTHSANVKLIKLYFALIVVSRGCLSLKNLQISCKPFCEETTLKLIMYPTLACQYTRQEFNMSDLILEGVIQTYKHKQKSIFTCFLGPIKCRSMFLKQFQLHYSQCLCVSLK